MATTSRRAFAVLSAGAVAITLAGCSLLGVGLTGNSAPASPADPTAGIETDVFTVEVGDCLNDGGVDAEVSTVTKIDCTLPHDSEAYAGITMDDGDYPGEGAVRGQAETDCTDRFDMFVGLDYTNSELEFAYYYPTAASWAQDDREILCLIMDPAGKVTGSLDGAAR